MGKSRNVGINNPMYGKKVSIETRIKMGKSRSGNKNHRWKGGIRLNNGYIHILMPNHPYADNTGYIFQHRLIMEQHLGRFLSAREKVHHINGILTDNRIENLRLFSSNGKHMIEGNHIGIDPKTKKFVKIKKGERHETFDDTPKGRDEW